MKRIIIGLLAACAVMGPLLAECKIHKIKHVPYVITKPGKYLLCNDVTYNFDPTDGVGAAIKIESSNVKLCLFAHNITIDDATGSKSAKGIWVNKGSTPNDRICEIEINNDSISGTTGTQGVGIVIDNACKVHLDNMFTVGNGTGLVDGLQINNSSDVLVENSEFSGHTSGSAANCAICDSLTFNNTTFANAGFNLSLRACTNTKILTCSFFESNLADLNTNSTRGLLIKNSSFSQQSAGELVLLGVSGASNDTRIEGCSFIAKTNGNSGITFQQGNGLVIDSCLFDLATDPAHPSTYSNLRISAFASDVLVTGSIFKGTQVGSRIGINAQGPNVRIQSCLLDGFTTGISLTKTGATVSSSRIASGSTGISLAGSSNTVENCSLTKNNLGIELTASAQNNTLSENTVDQCTVAGIRCAGNSNTISKNEVISSISGIVIATPAANNTVQSNVTHSNMTSGIEGVTGNTFYFNTSYNNGTNFIGPVPAIQNPGAKTVEGSNIQP